MTSPTLTSRARVAARITAGCALFASLAAHAQMPPSPQEPPPSVATPETPPAAEAPAVPAPPPPGAAPAPPAAAAPPQPAAPAPRPPQPPYPYPYYPYPYPQQGYPYPYASPYPYPYQQSGYVPPGPPPPGAPAAAAPPVVQVTPLAPPPGSARTPAEDPQADRGVLLPTAYTHPKGTIFISSYDLFLNQIGYAFTDDTQLTLTGVPPIGEERIFFVDLTLKTSLYRGGRVRVAGLGSVSTLTANEIGVAGVGRAGGVVQLCIEGKCDSSVSLSTNFTLLGAILMTNGVSGIFRVGRTVSLLAELDTMIPLVRDSAEFGGAMAGGGLRFHWTSWGLDLSLMHILGNDKPTLPIIALTYRSG